MKKIMLVSLCFIQGNIFAQCPTCPPGAITTLPANHTIAAGTTYCIAGPLNDPADYTVNGTLFIQSGSVTLGNLSMAKTGAVTVSPGGRLMAGSYTGEAGAPAALISNVNVCSYGYLYLSGAINPGETNFTVNDYGAFVIHGSWSTIISDTYFNLGLAAVVEMCNSFMFKSSTGFFTETSAGPSYVVTRAAMANGAGEGFLSRSGAASAIQWDIPGGPVAWVTHPAANTCVGAACMQMLPPGAVDNGVCGSVATGYPLVVVPLGFISVAKKMTAEKLMISAELSENLSPAAVNLESAEDGISFTGTLLQPSMIGDGHVEFTLPAAAATLYYRLRATVNNKIIYSGIIGPSRNNQLTGPTVQYIFPNPAFNYVNVPLPAAEKISRAELMNMSGQVVRKIAVNPGTKLLRFELPGGLPAGIYFIKIGGSSTGTRTFRVLKARS